MIYVISDTHFWHANIIKYAGRPYRDVEHMHTSMREMWNDIVSPTDHVLHLGDCAFISKWNETHAREFLKSLHGRITIVPGNHDVKRAILTYVDIGWTVHVGSFQVGDVLYSHYPLKAMGKAKESVEFNAHGHEHHFVPREDHWNACCDLRDWKPQPISEINFVNPDELGEFLDTPC